MDSLDDDQVLSANENFTISPSISGPAIAFFLSLEMGISLAINSTILGIIFLHPKPRSLIKAPSNIYLTSMLLVNLLATLTVMPMIIIASASGEWIFGGTLEEKVSSCRFAGYMYWYVIFLLIVTLAIISVDRWMFIVKSTLYKKMMTTPVAIGVVITAWLLTAVLNTTPLYGFGMFAYSSSPGSCFPVWKDQKAYLAFFVLVFLILISIIAASSIWTFCFSRRFIRRMSLRNIDASGEAASVYTFRWRKLIGIFGTLSIVYVVCFTPSLLYLLIRLATPIPLQILPAILIFFLLITILNPLVQIFFRRDIKNVILDFLAKTPCYTKEEVDYEHRSRTRSNFELQHALSLTAMGKDVANGGSALDVSPDEGHSSDPKSSGKVVVKFEDSESVPVQANGATSVGGDATNDSASSESVSNGVSKTNGGDILGSTAV
ncbi:PREDICTED: trace amine-associated receptor 7a-like [Amphimedon queenslandica]|uniref:G-protein coupled receptors family 1 profile domain-containing protein n=1 Tax=Amphimedon queenslandica TaxID=400682 RepID=A0A1X7U8U2_AMPQE|nr:PREDICTED: trace amine-associated receptor 7a-like [Amphimedon queenslandica]|eukprot:XP_011405824.1 PREDICTED: trace amine-associated receptor 7a-like [Amphimedon queenslandica]